MSTEKDLKAQIEKLQQSLNDEVAKVAQLTNDNASLQQSLTDEVSKVEVLTNDKASLQELVDELKSQLASAQTNLEELNDALLKSNQERDEALQANKSLIEAMDTIGQGADNGQKPSPLIPSQPSSTDLAKLSFEKDGVRYGFNFAKITHKKMAVSAEEIAVDESLQAELISLKSGMLKVL